MPQPPSGSRWFRLQLQGEFVRQVPDNQQDAIFRHQQVKGRLQVTYARDLQLVGVGRKMRVQGQMFQFYSQACVSENDCLEKTTTFLSTISVTVRQQQECQQKPVQRLITNVCLLVDRVSDPDFVTWLKAKSADSDSLAVWDHSHYVSPGNFLPWREKWWWWW